MDSYLSKKGTVESEYIWTRPEFEYLPILLFTSITLVLGTHLCFSHLYLFSFQFQRKEYNSNCHSYVTLYFLHVYVDR